MANTSMRTQMEASMMSQFLLLIGLTLMVIFNLFFGESGWGYKILVTFNLLAGWILISSYLVTTYQQYGSYMGAMGYDPAEEKKQIRSKGNIFKRIGIAIKNKRKKNKFKKMIEKSVNESPVPQLIKDALENQDKFKIKLKGGKDGNE